MSLEWMSILFVLLKPIRRNRHHSFLQRQVHSRFVRHERAVQIAASARENETIFGATHHHNRLRGLSWCHAMSALSTGMVL